MVYSCKPKFIHDHIIQKSPYGLENTSAPGLNIIAQNKTLLISLLISLIIINKLINYKL